MESHNVLIYNNKNRLEIGEIVMINYKEKPFYLSEDEIAWVKDTFNSMTLEEKIGQLFCPVGLSG
jgi:hypothetical protein